ncbi:VIR protein [Plasmodium vivax]|uniref:VIR protein n=1 Tax=Plasmodium vivax TaxID=5855 RepID=A0A1G4GT77_PLAVI|nr:VIR protein [Plasmodium vivax]
MSTTPENKFLHPYQLYNDLYTNDSGQTEDFSEEYCSDINTELKRSGFNGCKNVESVCKIIVKYMFKLKGKDHNIITEGCKYLYYFIYDKLKECNCNNSNEYSLFQSLLKISCSEVEWDGCNDYINNIMYKDLFHKHNNLIYLYEIFKELKDVEDSTSSDNCNKAMKCVKEYDQYIAPCFGGVSSNYCHELKKFKGEYEQIIKNVMCDNVPKILKPVEGISIVSIILFHIITMLIVSVILYFVYKFTPFGPWLKLRLKRKKKVSHNIYHESNHYSHAPKPSDINLKNIPYNIAYNSSQNS